MNQKLNDAALRAVRAPGYEKGKSMCQRFARQVVESVYRQRFEALIHQPSAKAAGEAFRADGRYVVPKEHGSLPGDLLYKLTGSGGFGHVGIRVAGNRVAENSSYHWNRSTANPKDGRGFRTLEEFGDYDLIVRLPEDEKMQN